MSPLKKIDYRELGKEASQEQSQQLPQGEAPIAPAEQPQQPAESAKTSFFDSLANKWSLMDKKMKIEAGIFLIVILSTVIMIGYYFSKSITPKVVIPEAERDWPEENIPPDTAPVNEFL